MDVAIIGVGNVGAALAEGATRAGHSVTLAARHPEHAAEVAAKFGVSAAPSASAAVEGAEVVILAVPYDSFADVVAEIGPAVAGKTVIDTTNALNSDYTDLSTGEHSAAEELQHKLPQASVVKAFNYVFATTIADPTLDGVQIDGFYAGDDADAKASTARLLQDLGYRPIDAGSLRMARTLEELALLNIRLQLENNWPWQSAFKLIGPTS